MAGFLALDGFIFARMAQQRLCQFPPRLRRESKAEKKHRLAAAGGVRGIQQIPRDFRLWYGGERGVWQFQGAEKIAE